MASSEFMEHWNCFLASRRGLNGIQVSENETIIVISSGSH